MDSRLLFLPTIVVYLIALITWWYLRSSDFGLIMGLLGFGNLLAAWWILHKRKDWWSFAILPSLLLWSALAYALVAMNNRLALSAVIASAVLAIMYWRLVFLYVFNNAAYRPFSLERLFGYISFITLFFTVASAYAFKTFLDWPTWQPAVVILAVQTGIAYQWQWVNKIEWKIAWPYLAFFPIATTELFFVLAFLPLEFNILGFLLASTWYAFSQAAIATISGKLNYHQMRLIGGGLIILWLALLLTARWF